MKSAGGLQLSYFLEINMDRKEKLLYVGGLIFTALYIFAELSYNLGFLEFLSSKNTEISVFDGLETLGKSISAIGLSLLLVHLVKKHKVLALVVLIPSVFFLEGYIFQKIIDDMPEQSKVGAYYLGVYRNALINNNLSSVELSKGSVAKQKVQLADISILEKKSTKQSVDGFLYKKLDEKSVDQFYGIYKQVSDKVDPYWGAYAIASKKFQNLPQAVQQKAVGEFQARAGGIPPGLSHKAFLDAVAKSNSGFGDYFNTVLVPANEKLGIEELKAGQIPLGLDRSAFGQFVNQKVSEVMRKSQISTDTVMNLPHANDVIGSVVIPPIAMLLSFMSMVFNSILLAWALVGRNLVGKALVVLGSIGSAVVLVMGSMASSYPTNAAWKTLLYAEEQLATYASGYMKVLHVVFINDEHPDETNIIHINSIGSVDTSSIEKASEQLQQANATGPAIDTSIAVDDNRINDTGYYGQVKIGKNPYISSDSQ